MDNTSALGLTKVAEADFPTEFGQSRIYGFTNESGGRTEEAVVLKMGDLQEPGPPLVRIHSECLTGDVFHSLRCDCRAQLEIALAAIGGEGRGLLIYEHQEGRGIGLLNKLRAYELRDRGADTVEANEQLGFDADLRAYEMAAGILKQLGVMEVRLMTNNPAKIGALEQGGIRVTERVSAAAPATASNHGYLRVKREKMGHLAD